MDINEVEKVIKDILTSPVISAYQKIRMEIMPDDTLTDIDYINLIIDCLKLDKELVFDWLFKNIHLIKKSLTNKDRVEICKYLKENIQIELLKVQYILTAKDEILMQAFSKIIEEGGDGNSKEKDTK